MQPGLSLALRPSARNASRDRPGRARAYSLYTLQASGTLGLPCSGLTAGFASSSRSWPRLRPVGPGEAVVVLAARRGRSFCALAALPSSRRTMPRSGRARSRASSRYGLVSLAMRPQGCLGVTREGGRLSPIQRGFHPHVTARGPYLVHARDIELVLGLLPEPGMFSGQVDEMPVWPDWTSSGMEMSMTPWPPVWEPQMPSRP